MSQLNPYASPGDAGPGVTNNPNPALSSVITNTLAVMLAQWPTILAVLLLIFFPWELLLSYITSHWIPEDDILRTMGLSTVGELSVLLLGHGIVTAATILHLRGEEAGLQRAIILGLATFPALFVPSLLSFPALFVPSLLSYFAISFSLLCVIPGIYLNIRWMYVGAAAVAERQGGLAPLQRSWELTSSQLLFSVAVFFMYGLPMLAVMIAAGLAGEFVPELNYWVYDALMTAVGDLVMLVVTVGFTCAYHELLSKQSRQAPLSQWPERQPGDFPPPPSFGA